VALLRSSHDEGRLARLLGLPVGSVDLGDVMAVDLDGVPAERPSPFRVRVALPLQHGGAALAEPVHVQDGHQVPGLVMRRVGHGLPHGALHDLGVPDQDPDPPRKVIHPHGQGHPQPDGQPLTQRAGGHVDPRQLRHRRGMSLQRAAELPEGQQLLIRDGADGLEHRVQQRRGVPLRQDESVIAQVLGVVDVEPQMVRVQDGQQVCGRHGRGGMPGSRGGRAPDAVHRQLGRQLVPFLGLVHHTPPQSVGPGRYGLPSHPSGNHTAPANQA
jgi:hypothetical protein